MSDYENGTGRLSHGHRAKGTRAAFAAATDKYDPTEICRAAVCKSQAASPPTTSRFIVENKRTREPRFRQRSAHRKGKQSVTLSDLGVVLFLLTRPTRRCKRYLPKHESANVGPCIARPQYCDCLCVITVSGGWWQLMFWGELGIGFADTFVGAVCRPEASYSMFLPLVTRAKRSSKSHSH